MVEVEGGEVGEMGEQQKLGPPWVLPDGEVPWESHHTPVGVTEVRMIIQ